MKKRQAYLEKQIQAAIKESGLTIYRLAKESGRISKQQFIKAVREYIANLQRNTEKVRPLIEKLGEIYPNEKKEIQTAFTKAFVVNLALLEGLLKELELSNEPKE